MDNSDQTKQTTEQTARRRLLKLAGYAPPALLGAMLLNRPAIAAAPPGKCSIGGGGFVSAPAGSCCPCVPAATQYNARNCCRDYCDPAACDAYAAGGNRRNCQRINGWCGTVPAACNCCIDRRGRFKCVNPGNVCQ